MGKVSGKVAFVTGAARGQGRSHAVKLAEEGAEIIAVDLCEQIASASYPMATPADLDETVAAIGRLGRRVVAVRADVRDRAALDAALAEGVSVLGQLDIVVANAGIMSQYSVHELTDEAWRDMLEVNLTGVWNTASIAIPHLVAGGRGGSIVLTSSGAGLRAYANMAHYVAAKHGVVGLMRALAIELAPHGIRVNSLNPTLVNTPMGLNDAVYKLFAPELDHPTMEQVMDRFVGQAALPVPWVEPADVSHALLYLVSDEGRFVTGVPLPVDAGLLVK